MSRRILAATALLALAGCPSPCAAELVYAVYTGSFQSVFGFFPSPTDSSFVLTFQYDTNAMTATSSPTGSSLTGTAVRVSLVLPGWSLTVWNPSADRVAFNDGSSSYQTDSASYSEFLVYCGGYKVICSTGLSVQASVSSNLPSLPATFATPFTYTTTPADTTSVQLDYYDSYYVYTPGEVAGPFYNALGFGYGDISSLTVSVNIPEASTWAMMLLGFAGLGFAGYRRANASRIRSLTQSSC